MSNASKELKTYFNQVPDWVYDQVNGLNDLACIKKDPEYQRASERFLKEKMDRNLKYCRCNKCDMHFVIESKVENKNVKCPSCGSNESLSIRE